MKRLAPLALVALLVTGCVDGKPAVPREEILVFAAASLTEAFTAIGEAFEKAHEGVTVRFNFGPSDGLATGINADGGADVFASASPKWMDAVSSDTGVTDRSVFARNRLVVLVPKDNPAAITTFADLARPGVKLVLAAPAVPIGGYARDALKKAHLEAAEANVVSNEEDVKVVVQKVVLGEADAGIVYATDLTDAVDPDVEAIAIHDDVNVIVSYPIAVIDGSEHASTARAFVAYVLGAGQAVLHDAGFADP